MDLLEILGDETNNEILLSEGKSSVEVNGKKKLGNGIALLSYVPSPKVLFKHSMDTDQVGQNDLFKQFDDLSRPTYVGKELDGIFLSIKNGLSEITYCSKSEPVEIIGDNTTQCVKVQCLIYNYIDFSNTELVLNTGNDWTICIRSHNKSGEYFKYLKSNGGLRATHICEITKNGGSFFFVGEIKKLLNTLRYFLTFTKGSWCFPVLPQGLDEKNEVVWQCYSSPKEHWKNVITWFPVHSLEAIPSLFSSFVKKSLDSDFIHEIIYWYQTANAIDKGVEPSIIMSQTAIERMAYEVVVNEKKLLSVKGFKDLRASDKFRLLFSSSKLPLEIPDKLEKLNKVAKNLKWADAPHALTEIRNALVHPEHRSSKLISEALYDGWKLSMWYLELSTLRLLGYNDVFACRIRTQYIGDIVRVPWIEDLDN